MGICKQQSEIELRHLPAVGVGRANFFLDLSILFFGSIDRY